jgi:hypothetical protein
MRWRCRASGVPKLWGEGSVWVTAWLQVAAVFQVILLIWPGITTALLIVLAAITQSVGSRGRWAVAATLSVNLILLAQLQMQRGYWHRSVLQHVQIATKGVA